MGLRSFAHFRYNAGGTWSVAKQNEAETGSVWAAGSALERGKGVITMQEEPNVRERIKAGPGS
jgi:hypothetical protein